MAHPDGDDDIQLSDGAFEKAIYLGAIGGIPVLVVIMLGLIALGGGDLREQWPAALYAGVIGGVFAGGVVMVGRLGHAAERAQSRDRAGLRRDSTPKAA